MNISRLHKCLIAATLLFTIMTGCNNTTTSNIDESLKGKWQEVAGNFQILISKNEVIKISSDTVKLTVKKVETIKKQDCPECEALIEKVYYDQSDVSPDTFTFYNYTSPLKEAIKVETGGETRMFERSLVSPDL